MVPVSEERVCNPERRGHSLGVCMASYKLRMGCQHNYEKKECSKCIQCSSLAGESPVVRCASSLGTVTYHKAKRSTEQCQPQPTPFLRQVVKGCFHEEGGRDREYLCRSVIVSQCAVQVRHILVNRKRYIYIFFKKTYIADVFAIRSCTYPAHPGANDYKCWQQCGD